MRVRSMLMSLGLTWVLASGAVLAQALDPEPVNPPPFPARLRPSNLATNRTVLRPSRPLTNGFTYAAPSRVPAATQAVNANALQFDSKEKTVHVKSGESEAKFTFAVTNVSKEDVTIMSVHTSCGCTAARLPSTPWVLKPGEGGEVGATMNLAGKFGTVAKTVTVVSTVGSVPLLVKSVLPKDAYEQMQRMGDRSRNLQIAAADRQAVFRGIAPDAMSSQRWASWARTFTCPPAACVTTRSIGRRWYPPCGVAPEPSTRITGPSGSGSARKVR